MGDTYWLLMKTILSLGAVVSLIFAISWAAKKYLRPETWSRMPGGPNIKVLGMHPIEARKRLVVIEVAAQKHLLAVSETSISYLCEVANDAVIQN